MLIVYPKIRNTPSLRIAYCGLSNGQSGEGNPISLPIPRTYKHKKCPVHKELGRKYCILFLLLLNHHLLHQLIIGMNIECVFALPLYFHGCAVKLSLNLSAQKKKSNARFIGLYIIRLYKVAAKVVYCYYARLLLRECLRPTQYKFLKNLVPKLQIYPIHKNDLLYSSH